MMFLDCPAVLDEDGPIRCGLPAEVQTRHTLTSTSGPVESVKIRCPNGHWFNGPVESLTWTKDPERFPHQDLADFAQDMTGLLAFDVVDSQAELVLRNIRLTDELKATIDDLRASRRRLVQAQDCERQRLERDLHDGAQQQLVALESQLSLLQHAADPDEVKGITGQLRSGLQAALDNLRALAHGIYPPLLAGQGLAAALRAQATRTPVPVSIKAEGIGRYPRDAEAAVYFCTLEALQNVTKYAHASRVTITLYCPNDNLIFTISDDGIGFDTTTATHGTGLQGMADRLVALGGTLQVHSEPGSGTTVTGSLPVPQSRRL